MEEKKLNEYTEFEVKFEIDISYLIQFKKIAESLSKRFVYVEGPDYYFVKPNSEDFKRYRVASYGDNRSEITTKKKTGNNNNIYRIEKNLRVDGNNPELVRSMIEDDGYVFNFSIVKYCHIYDCEDATLVFYTVIDTTPNTKDFSEKSFLEIEVNEELCKTLTQEEAQNIIKKYEDKLKVLGISSNKRLKLSFYERYKK